jgi:hypothetical protein
VDKPEYSHTPDKMDRIEIGRGVLEAFTIGDIWDEREWMEIAEAYLDPIDYINVEVHTSGLHTILNRDCLLCLIIGTVDDEIENKEYHIFP